MTMLLMNMTVLDMTDGYEERDSSLIGKGSRLLCHGPAEVFRKETWG